LEIGININGDLPFEDIRKGAELAEELDYSHIWVGESIHFKHPFPVITYIAHHAKNIRVGSGIISYFFNRSIHIKKAYENLVEAYGNRFAITLAPGDMNSLKECGIDLKHPIEKLKETIADLRKAKTLGDTPLFVGASGPKMIETGGTSADGVLLNYAHPDYVKWALKHLESETYVGVYAPALLTPDGRNEKAALIASSFVAAGSNPSFQKQFGLQAEIESIRQILREKRFNELKDKRTFLLDRFAITGDEATLLERIDEFKRMGIDQVVLGSPFNYNIKAIIIMGRGL
jgi:5,10-methylenetetrahydromethanopterin reductase